MGIVIENSKNGHTYSLNMEHINDFILRTSNIIYNDIKMRLK